MELKAAVLLLTISSFNSALSFQPNIVMTDYLLKNDSLIFINQCQRHTFYDPLLPQSPYCPMEVANWKQAIYLLYDVNYPEGFKLRRDVYIRLAVFVHQVRKNKHLSNIRLVLPPWRRLYHWKSSHLNQENLPWSTFFDLESLRRFAPVLDFTEFQEEIGKYGLQESPYVPVHQTFQLLQFKEMFENGVFHDKFEIMENDCRKEQYFHGSLLQQQKTLLDDDFVCVRFQGTVNLLEKLLRKTLKNSSSNLKLLSENDPKIVAVLNAEIVLHENWGDRKFWQARRSMRFTKHLMDVAENFRRIHLNSSLDKDLVQRPPMWEYEHHYRGAIGGPYLCAHLRRGDFVHGRESSTPTLRSAAEQIRQALNILNLTTVFIATDADAFEFKNLKAYLQRIKVVRFTTESLEQKAVIKDGGVAIVDQLICSHARHFIGTFESTFTYRICEEREILGFPKSSSFNTFCKSTTANDCPKNSVWPIVY